MTETSAHGSDRATSTGASRLIIHPIVIGALAVLVLNDHFLEPRWPSWLTGKLSDVAGLIVLAAIVIDLCDVVRPTSRSISFAASGAIAVGFVWVKTTSTGASLYRDVNRVAVAAIDLFWWGDLDLRPMVVVDATDLLALPALAVPLALRERQRRRSGSSATIARR